MNNIRLAIKKGNLSLVGGVPGIGKKTFILNLLLDEYLKRNVLILKNTGSRKEMVEKLNKILYADGERKNRFQNFIVEEKVLDIEDAKYLIEKNICDIEFVIVDEIDMYTSGVEESIKEFNEISKKYRLPILIIKEIYTADDSFNKIPIEDLELSQDTLNLFSNIYLLNRESYYVRRGSTDLVVERVNFDTNKNDKRKFKFNSDYERLYVFEEIPEEPEEEKGDFSKIAGYEELKKELLLIKSWWDNKDELRKNNIDIPSGLLIYGPIGTGKSMFAREFVKLFPDAAIIKIDNKSDYSSNEITEKFNYARSLNKLAFILIDEIDYVARRDERELLTQLDGLGGDNNNIFVIATCNGFDNMNPAITRVGRIDYLIGLGNPTKKERINLFKFYFEKYGIQGDYDFEYLAQITKGENAVNIKAITNETRLRYGQNPSISDIESCIDRIDKREREYYGDIEPHDKYMDAVHEIGHACIAMTHRDLFDFYKVSLEEHSLAGGLCKVFSKEENPGSIERSLADIEISMGGYLACQMLFNYMDKGAASDLERARAQSAALVNTYGYEGFEPILNHDRYGMPTSQFKKKNNEKKSEKILARCEKNVRKIIKKYKNEILELANQLLKNKVLTKDDLIKVLD